MRVHPVAAAVLTVLATMPARALTFDFTTIPGDTLTPAQASAFAAAGQAWSNIFTDPITVATTIGFTSLGANILGQTTPTVVNAPYAGVRTEITQDAKSAEDQRAVAALPSTVPNGTILLTSAQVKALNGAVAPGTDGKIEFNSNFNFATSRNSDGSTSATSYDLIGIAEHEIGHLLGFISGVDFSGPNKTILDLYRYSASNSPSFAAGQGAYFSLDYGVTSIAPFSDGTSNQASHWANNYQVNGVPALMDPEGAQGQSINITPLDSMALDILGFDPVGVPEPMPVTLLAAAVLTMIGFSRRG